MNNPPKWFPFAVIAAVAICFVLLQNVKMDSESYPFIFDAIAFIPFLVGLLGFIFVGRKRLKTEDELESRIQSESSRFSQWMTWFIGYAAAIGMMSASYHLHQPKLIPFAVGIILTVSVTSLISSVTTYFIRRKYIGK